MISFSPLLAADVDLAAGKMSTLDVVLFFATVLGVIAFGIWQGRRESKGAADSGGAAGYFLAGRGLTWWLVGFSLISANISTEQFVGMSGQAADWLGLAIASYEWLSAIALVVVAFVFLPRLLRCGLYTIPEFLEYRYGVVSRSAMAIATLFILVGVPTASVIYSGAKVVSVFFQGIHLLGLDLGNVTTGCWIIGICAVVNVLLGGLKAGAWTGMVWGAALIIGGVIVTCLAFGALKEADPHQLILTKVENSKATVEDLQGAGAWERFRMLNNGLSGEAMAVAGENQSGGKLHMVLPKSDRELPWTALVLGLWIPIFFYWGLNQHIVQRTLGSRSLAEGQKGIVLAAFLKLIIPFIVVIPGILCFNLYGKDLRAEAVKKNEKTLAEMGSATSPKVYAFTENFAVTQPEHALAVLIHNARVTGVHYEALQGVPPEQMAVANGDFLKNAAEKGIESGTKLIGYDYDAAFPTLLRNLLRPGISWFVLAAIFGAVISSLAAMLNSAATIATMDIFNKVKKNASQATLVGAGRIFTALFVLIAILVATFLAESLSSIFSYIQEFQGFISPGVLAVFLVGFLVPRAPRYLGWLGLLVNAVLYALLKWWLGPVICNAGLWFAPQMSFLDRMGICFLTVLAICAVATKVNPLPAPVKMPVTDLIALESSTAAKAWGAVAIVATVVLYVIFW